MKTKLLFLSLFTVSVLLLGCDKDDDNGKGTLSYRTTVWNAELPHDGKNAGPDAKGDTNTTELINARHFIPKIEISTDPIADGVSADAINWTVMYESTEEMLHTDRSISIALPVGEYVSFRITQRNRVYWVCTFEGDTMEFPSLNDSGIGPNEQLVNYFGEEGLHKIQDGNFVLTHPNERLGVFEILPGQTTKVTSRVNIITIDWIDNDGSGNWSDGDELTNWTVPDGVTTMSDFIVEYE